MPCDGTRRALMVARSILPTALLLTCYIVTPSAADAAADTGNRQPQIINAATPAKPSQTTSPTEAVTAPVAAAPEPTSRLNALAAPYIAPQIPPAQQGLPADAQSPVPVRATPPTETPALTSPLPVPVCAGNENAIGVSRIIEIDAATGPLFGGITKQKNEPNFLGPKEVVLTFDDGPVPWITGPILKELERHCTRATFFSVGRMAVAYPATLKAVVEAGHTAAGHTWSHPLNLRRLKLSSAVEQIERGFSAIAAATDGDVAPFFRFPGLSDSGPLLDHLQARNIATFTVDVVSDDSFISDPDKLARITLDRIKRTNGGIVLFHDIKPATAKALPTILDALATDGYTVVHMRARRKLTPHPDFPPPDLTKKAAQLETAAIPTGDGTTAGPSAASLPPRLVPFYSAEVLERALDPAVIGRPVTVLSTPPRQRVPKAKKMPIPPAPERKAVPTTSWAPVEQVSPELVAPENPPG